MSKATKLTPQQRAEVAARLEREPARTVIIDASEPVAEMVDPASLRPWPDNPRLNEGEPVEKVADSIKRFGFAAPIVARRENREIIAGHTRWKAAMKLRLEAVPVRFVDLDEREAHLLALADNRLGELAEWDTPELRAQLQAYDVNDQAIAGWTEQDMRELERIARTDVEVTEDEVPELPTDPVTRVGDIWTLGNHRLVCGDACIDGAWEAVGRFDAIFTSPPYTMGSAFSNRNKTIKRQGGNVYADEVDDTADNWLPMMRAWSRRAFDRCGCVIVNLQMLTSNKRLLLEWWHEMRERFCDVIIWDKGAGPPAKHPGQCSARFEYLLVFGAPDCSRSLPFSNFQGTLSNVYSGPAARLADKVTDQHHAVFPVHLPSFVMTRMCIDAKIWCDPFAGTGTMVVAAEQLERVCVAMEVSPAYCDVIVERWERLTGGKATRQQG